jgi:tetratricopeptide (TPR) repeat protein
MKILLPVAFLLLPLLAFCSGSKQQDSLRKKYAGVAADSTRADILVELANLYAQDKPDSELYIAQRALALSRKIKYYTGEMSALKLMAEGYEFLGNYPLALQYYLQRLKLEEKKQNPERVVTTLLSIGNLYQLEGDYKLAIDYAQKGYDIIDKNKLENYRWYSYMTFGDTYDKMNKIPEALFYDKKAYDMAVQQKNEAWLGMVLNNTANSYSRDKQYTIALADYRRAVPYLKANHIESFLCESCQGIANILLNKENLDSAAYYAKLSLNLAVSRSFSEKYLRSCQLLTAIYKSHHLPDSALEYQSKLLTMKDSIYSRDKERQVANLTISEELRQRERAQEKLEEEAERNYKLKLLTVGLLIPFSFLISLVLSKRKMHAKIIEFSGIVSLLLLFEYLTILLHPMVVSWTNHSPFLEILIFVAIAAVLTPSHHRLEHWMLHKLTAHKHHAAATPVPVVVNEVIDKTGPDE